MRKRVEAPKRTRSTSSRPAKKGKITPRFRALSDPTRSKITQSLRCELIYMEYGVSINPGVGTAGTYVFTANGCYDPNVTGVGHQPAGFDQLMAIYNEYVVIGSTITARFIGTDSNIACICGVALTDFSTTSADPRVYVENGNCKWGQMSTFKSGGDMITITHKADISKFSRQSIVDEDSFSGTASTNPTDTHYYHLWVSATDALSDPGATVVNVEIKYDVIFRDPAQTALS